MHLHARLNTPGHIHEKPFLILWRDQADNLGNEKEKGGDRVVGVGNGAEHLLDRTPQLVGLGDVVVGLRLLGSLGFGHHHSGYSIGRIMESICRLKGQHQNKTTDKGRDCN